jgi:hypothetical protein
MKIGNKEISNNNLIIAVLIGVILLLAKCNSDNKAEYKAQSIISQNNIEVLNDSINTFKTKNGSLINERGILIASKKELKTLNSELYKTVNDLEKEIDGIEPTIVIDYQTSVVHDTVFLNSNLLVLNDSTYEVNFNKDTIYNENNSRKIAGSITIKLLSDTSQFNTVEISEVKLTKDEINMDASLVIGMKDDKLKVWLSTKYPGFQADQIEAVTLDPNIHPELRKLNNKKFSVGPYVGFGIGQNFSISPSIGIGIQYGLFKF